MLNVLATIWTLIGIMVGGVILLVMAIVAIYTGVEIIAGFIKGVKKK